MVILEDTRNKIDKHGLKHDYFVAEGIEIVRTKLLFGDYALWGGITAVDTKANVEEIAQNIGGAEHARFREECKLARKVGGQLVVLVENEHGYQSVEDVILWVNPNYRKTARSIEGPRLAKAMQTMADRYGVRFEFCAPDEAGRRIVELLEADNGKWWIHKTAQEDDGMGMVQRPEHESRFSSSADDGVV